MSDLHPCIIWSKSICGAQISNAGDIFKTVKHHDSASASVIPLGVGQSTSGKLNKRTLNILYSSFKFVLI